MSLIAGFVLMLTTADPVWPTLTTEQRPQVVHDLETWQASEKAAREQILALPTADRAASMAVAIHFTEQAIGVEYDRVSYKSAEDQSAAFRAAALITDQLAMLADNLGFLEAAACHRQERDSGWQMAHGHNTKRARCRNAAYPDSFDAAAAAAYKGVDRKLIAQRSEDWANAAHQVAILKAELNAPDPSDPYRDEKATLPTGH